MKGPVPRLGIGLPVYNAERYVEQALDSILAQSFGDFELIISDNASTDRTGEMCRARAARDRRIRYYRNDRNLGAAPNFNRVFALSETEYFKFAPYDDLIEPEFLATCVRVLDADPEVVVCYTTAKIIDEHGAFVVDHDPGPDVSSPRADQRFRRLLLERQYALQMMGVVRSRVLRSTSLFGSFPSCDEILLAELALRGRFHMCPERLYVYRRHPEQSTMRQATQRLRVPFFDTSLAGQIVLPTWRYLMASLGAVKSAPISRVEKGRCYAHVARWMLVPPHFRALGKDVLLAFRAAAARSGGRSEGSVGVSGGGGAAR